MAVPLELEDIVVTPFEPVLEFPYNGIFAILTGLVCVFGVLVYKSIKKILDRLGTRSINQIVVPILVRYTYLK
jgi:hypothetical protein